MYLHYFKEGQPSINWLDPTFAGMRLVIGDALHSLGDLGTSALRLDANGFLGVEKSAEGLPAWSEGHPLSHAANHIIAGMVRKVGGFTFQELNLTIEDIRDTGAVGADLSYDFVTRPGYHHALATGQTEFLRLALTTALGDRGRARAARARPAEPRRADLRARALGDRAPRRPLPVPRRRGHRCVELAEIIRAELTEKLTVDADYNLVFTQNGIACTTASLIAATQGKARADDITEDDVPAIRDAHLLLAKYNAWQPGVFALSGWDLTGTLTLPAERGARRSSRPATPGGSSAARTTCSTSYPEAERSSAGVPRARSLYGSLPAQLERPGLVPGRAASSVLATRRAHEIAMATQVDIPAGRAAEHARHGAPAGRRRPAREDAPLQITALNFLGEPIEGTVRSESLVPRSKVIDAATGDTLAHVDDLNSFGLRLPAYGGLFLLLEAPDPAELAHPLTAAIPIVRPDLD